MSPRRGEDGVGVVLTLALVAVLVLVGAVGAGTIGVVATHRRVQAAADLAALAGAEAARTGGEPCREAGRIASANQVELRQCVASSGVVEVVVAEAVELAGSWTLAGRARAGPAADPG